MRVVTMREALRVRTSRLAEEDLTCDECGVQFDFLVQIGKEPDYEQGPSSLCLQCLQAALLKLDCVEP